MKLAVLRRRTGWLLIGTSGLLLAIALNRALLPGQMLVGHDAWQLMLPLKMFIRSQVANGHFPLWYPYDGLGISIPGSLAPGLLEPLNVLLLFFEPAQMVRWATLLCIPIGGVGTYLLARSLGLNRPASTFSAVAFALSGVLLSQNFNLLYTGAFSRVPFVLWAANRLGRGDKRRWRFAAALALSEASILWSGDPEAALVAALLAGVLLLTHRQCWRRWLVPSAVAAGLGVAMVLPLVLPALRMFSGSSRRDQLGAEEALSWSLHPVRLLEMLIGPPFNLDHMTGNIVTQFGGQNSTFWSESIFVGTLVALLAIVGVRWRNWGPKWLLSAMVLISLWLALGRYGHLYAHISVLMHFRYPEKLLIWTMLGVALLAGRGVQSLRAEPLPLGVLLSFGSVLIAVGVPMARIIPGFGPLLVRGVLALALGAVISRASDGWHRLGLVSALALLELALVNGSLVKSEPQARWLPEHSPIPEISLGERLCSDLGYAGAELPPGHTSWEDMRQGELNVLYSGSPAIYNVRNTIGLVPAKPHGLEQLCSVLDVCDDICGRMLGARWDVVQPTAAPRLLATGEYRLVRNLELPRCSLLEDLRAPPYASIRPARLYTDEWATIVALHRREIDPDAQVLLAQSEAPSDASSWTGSGQATITDTATEQAEHPDRISLAVKADSAGVLVVHEAFTRDWQASLDGQPAHPLRVNLGMLGVPVPAGEHRIELRYHPWGHPWSLLAYVLGLLTSFSLMARTR